MQKYFHNISFRTVAIATGSISVGFVTGSYIYRFRQNQRENSLPAKMTVDHKIKTPFQTLFAVPMTCDGCVKSVTESLYKLDGITKVEANLKDQLVTVEGTAAPSAIVSAIEATGRDAILRGTGGSNDAAVCILETYDEKDKATEVPADGRKREVRGLARMVQVSPDTTLVDLTLRGVEPGSYKATIREYGDLKDGAKSTGSVWAGGSGTTQPRGILGSLEIGKDGRGAVFLDHPFQVWETIGHAMVVSRQDEGQGQLKNDANTIVGVIARSAGMWDNDKTVCSCTGKTLWEERKEQVHDHHMM